MTISRDARDTSSEQDEFSTSDSPSLRRRSVLVGGAAMVVGAGLLSPARASAGTRDGAETTTGAGPNHLSPAQRVGQRVIWSYPGLTPPTALFDAIRAGLVGGVIFFGENIDRSSRNQIQTVTRDLAQAQSDSGVGYPLLVMTDQEGGLVKRLGGAPSVSARQMGARGGAFSAREGRRTAANLRDAGINVDLAPVLDVGRPGGVIAETERSFGTTAARVKATAVPFAKSLQAGGVAATGKHFPGFGGARENTDFAVERIDLSKAELRRVDEKPYAAFEAAGGELVMLSTAIYPAFSNDPAAFTRAIATGELRDRLGFEGVTITDALETPAVAHFGNTGKVAVAGARAGADLLLFARISPAEKAWKALVGGLRGGRLGRQEFEEAAQRVLDLRAGLRR